MARPVGNKNKKKRFIAELVAAKHNFDPLDILIHVAKGDYEALGLMDTIAISDRIQAAKEVAKYLYSQKVAVKHEVGEEEFMAFAKKLLVTDD